MLDSTKFAVQIKTQRLYENIEEIASTTTWEPIGKSYVHKSSEQQVLIGDIIRLPDRLLQEYCPEAHSGGAFFTRALPNLSCPFCFDHPLDHVPMMMLMEVARQYATAVSHRHLDVPLKGYIGVADSIGISMTRFLELDQPIYFLAFELDIKYRKKTHTRKSEGYFLQKGLQCAHVSGEMRVLTDNLYQRLRKGCRLEMLSDSHDCSKAIYNNLDVMHGRASAQVA